MALVMAMGAGARGGLTGRGLGRGPGGIFFPRLETGRGGGGAGGYTPAPSPAPPPPKPKKKNTGRPTA